MIQVAVEYIVRDGNEHRFELSYGPGGVWSALLASCPGFRGVTVLRKASDVHTYLTFETWDGPADRERALAERQTEHQALLSQMDEWVESRVELGIYGMLAEASVRPSPRPRKGTPSSQRSSGRPSRRTV